MHGYVEICDHFIDLGEGIESSYQVVEVGGLCCRSRARFFDLFLLDDSNFSFEAGAVASSLLTMCAQVRGGGYHNGS